MRTWVGGNDAGGPRPPAGASPDLRIVSSRGRVLVVELGPASERQAREFLVESDRFPDWMEDRDPERRLQGFRSQVAVAAWLDVAPGRAGIDGGADLLWRGRTIQVKFNSHRYGDLYTPFYDPVWHADLGVLVVPGPSPLTLKFAGWTTAGDMNRAHPLAWQRHARAGGPGLTQHELRPMGTFFADAPGIVQGMLWAQERA